jgi:protein subunit release factor B
MWYHIEEMKGPKYQAIEKKMKKLGIKDSDIKEHFVRASGPGGQKVNKASSCVYLKHLPTNLSVKCQKYRLQSQNRLLARQILVKKIEKIILEKKRKEQNQAKKKRFKQGKRSKKTKEKILHEKRLKSEKKKFRREKQITGERY